MPGSRKSNTLRAVAKQRIGVKIPGCYDVTSALDSQTAGYPAVFVSGSSVGAALLGEELKPSHRDWYLELLGQICGAVDIPVIADGETGFGDPLTFAADLEHIGAAGLQIEDRASDGDLLAEDKSVQQIKELVQSTNLFVLARTDETAISKTLAITRANRFLEVGADAVIPILSTLLASSDQDQLRDYVRRLGQEVAGPVIIHSPTGSNFDRMPLASWGISVEIASQICLHDSRTEARDALRTWTRREDARPAP